MKKYIKVASSDGIHKLNTVVWEPDTEVKAVVQIIHGMVEHIERYDEMAESLNKKGIAVIGCDQLGHGGSVLNSDELGFIAEKGGKGFLLKDQYSVTRRAKKLFPGKPVFLFGFSMGSFVARRYITIWGKELSGALIAGTGQESHAKCTLGLFFAYSLMFLRGTRYRSKFLYYISNGAYSIVFNTKGKGSWLSKNREVARGFKQDPLCGFIFTTSAYHTLFSMLSDLSLKKNDDRIPKNLPVIFLAGMDDPVGNYSKGVLDVYNEYVHLGIKDVDIKLYKDDRHEIMREDDKEDVFDDIASFVLERC